MRAAVFLIEPLFGSTKFVLNGTKLSNLLRIIQLIITPNGLSAKLKEIIKNAKTKRGFLW